MVMPILTGKKYKAYFMNFDEKIERRGTHSDKWDMMESKYGVSPKDGIPMWVADMDFCTPPEVLDAIHQRTQHGVFWVHT